MATTKTTTKTTKTTTASSTKKTTAKKPATAKPAATEKTTAVSVKKPAVKKTAPATAVNSGKKKILFVASECQPFVVTGGLAEVIGSLSKALAATGRYDVRVVVPLYSDIKPEYVFKCAIAIFSASTNV